MGERQEGMRERREEEEAEKEDFIHVTWCPEMQSITFIVA